MCLSYKQTVECGIKIEPGMEYQSDAGSRANTDIKFYKPRKIEDDYYIIGVTATNNSGLFCIYDYQENGYFFVHIMYVQHI